MMWKQGVLLLGIALSVCGDILWECDNFPAEAPVDGCDWVRGDIHWEEENAEGVPDPAGRPGNALRVFYANDSWSRNEDNIGGIEFWSYPFEPADALTLEYEVYFSENFDFVWGGKLPGLYGGEGPHSCSPDVTTHNTGVTSPCNACECAHEEHTETCFSTRYMWRDYGRGEVYTYVPNDSGDWFCVRPDVICDFRFGHSYGRGRWRFETGQWYTLSQDLKLNTPGVADSVLKVRLDGEEVFRIEGLSFRRVASTQINRLYFSTYFGGSTFWWASTDDVYSYFRNFKIMDYVE